MVRVSVHVHVALKNRALTVGAVHVLQVNQVGAAVSVLGEDRGGRVLTVLYFDGFRAVIDVLRLHRTHVHVGGKTRVVANTNDLNTGVGKLAQSLVQTGVYGFALGGYGSSGRNDKYGGGLGRQNFSGRILSEGDATLHEPIHRILGLGERIRAAG